MNDVCKRRLPLDFHSYTRVSLCHSPSDTGRVWKVSIGPQGLSSPVLAGLLLWALCSHTSSDLPESLPETPYSNQDRTSCSYLLSIKNCPSQARAFKVLCYLCQVNILLLLKWGWFGEYVCGGVIFGQLPIYYTPADCLCILLCLYFID